MQMREVVVAFLQDPGSAAPGGQRAMGMMRKLGDFSHLQFISRVGKDPIVLFRVAVPSLQKQLRDKLKLPYFTCL